jgi:hypothetical protein
MTRTRLPNRRPNETAELIFNATPYAVTIGYNPDTGRIGEVFTHGAKVGSNMDAILDDACVALSLLLQHGLAPSALAASMGRDGDGKRSSSIVGALADLLAEAERVHVGASGPCRADVARVADDVTTTDVAHPRRGVATSGDFPAQDREVRS